MRAAGPNVDPVEVRRRIGMVFRRASSWDDVKDKLKQSGMALSGGQRQRLCIVVRLARLIGAMLAT